MYSGMFFGISGRWLNNTKDDAGNDPRAMNGRAITRALSGAAPE